MSRPLWIPLLLLSGSLSLAAASLILWAEATGALRYSLPFDGPLYPPWLGLALAAALGAVAIVLRGRAPRTEKGRPCGHCGLPSRRGFAFCIHCGVDARPSRRTRG